MKKLITSIAVLATPVLALAQTAPINDINGLTAKLVQIGNIIIYILISLAVIYIIYNIVMYLVRGSDPEGRSEALKSVGWGIVGLAVILSIWGLVNILTNTFRTTPVQQTVPLVNTNTIPIVQ